MWHSRVIRYTIRYLLSLHVPADSLVEVLVKRFDLVGGRLGGERESLCDESFLYVEHFDLVD